MLSLDYMEEVLKQAKRNGLSISDIIDELVKDRIRIEENIKNNINLKENNRAKYDIISAIYSWSQYQKMLNRK